MTDDVERAVLLASEYLDMHYLDRARRQAELVLASQPENISAAYILGQVESLEGHDRRAHAILRDVVAQAPEWTPGLRAYARACDLIDFDADAKRAARRAVELEPDSVESLLVLAEVTRIEHPIRARRLVDRAASLAPDDPGVHWVRALVYRRLLMFGRARESVRKVVAADPGDWRAVYQLAVLEGRGLRFRRAITGIFTAAAQFPQSGAMARDFLRFVVVRLLVVVQLALLALCVVVAPTESRSGAPSRPEGVPRTFDRPTSIAPLPSRPLFPDLYTEVAPPPARSPIAPAAYSMGESRADAPDASAPADSLRPWARVSGALGLLVIGLIVAGAASAVPRGGWSVVRDVCGDFWTTIRIMLVALAAALLAIGVISGTGGAVTFAGVVLLFGVISSAYFLIRNL